MKKHKYRIIGVISIILVIAGLMVVTPIYAEEGTTETTEELTCIDLSEKYGIYIDKGSGENAYDVIKDNSIACGDSASTTELKIIAVNGVTDTSGQVLNSKNKKATVQAALMIDGTKHYMTVTLENVANPNETLTVEYSIISEAAGGGSVTETNTNYYGLCATLRGTVSTLSAEGQSFYKQSIPYCWNERVVVNYTQSELETKINNINALWTVYNNQKNSGSEEFNITFNEIKTKAQNAGNTIATPSSETIGLKCSYTNVKNTKEPTTYTNKYGDSLSSAEYYLNKDYYYSTETTREGTVKYTYNYAVGNTVTETYDACERTCEESVKVEYGPPIASKAGLCFEYKVKVSSYVSCTADIIAPTPDEPSGYCNPAPKCTSLAGVLRKKEQAGPTQEFDSCIQKCDGGEYSEKCSLKCYKEVYGSTNSQSKIAISYNTATATQLADSNSYTLAQCLKDNQNYDGCYGYVGGTINWYSLQNYDLNGNYTGTDWNNIQSLGRWYLDRIAAHGYNYWSGGYDVSGIIENCNSTYCGSYVVDENGFYRANYSGSLCTDNCIWRTDSCGSNVYLNPGTAQADYKANSAEYEKAAAACIGAATCSQHTAEFSISINYDTTDDSGVKKVNKITFPYTSKTDTLYANKANNIPNRSVSSILDYSGCYADSTIGNQYMTEWSFPGTYIHNKTGEISFQKPSDTSGWYYDDKKFCMPLDAESVNTKWWEWYKLGNNCYTTAQIEQELQGSTGTSNGYNIEANTDSFGYFGWNFDVKCFYALRNEVCNVEEDGCCGPPTTETKTNGVSNYTVRSVDRDNLFPNAPVAGVVDDTKREIGFNWTDKALSLKNSDYSVNPTKLIEHIQNTANTLYIEESNLDYQFYLTPSTLNAIRNYNKNNPYGTWNGKAVEKNGIMVYSSNLFRATGENNILMSIDGAIKKTGTIGVNNENYTEFGG